MLKRSFGYKDRAGKATKPVKRSFRDDAKKQLMEQLNQPSSPPCAVYVSWFPCLSTLFYSKFCHVRPPSAIIIRGNNPVETHNTFCLNEVVRRGVPIGTLSLDTTLVLKIILHFDRYT